MAVRNIELGEKAKGAIEVKHPHANLHLETLDISDSKSIDDFVSVVKQKYGQIQVLVNNAGIAAKGDEFNS
jgi:short-subunit dehydrogenase involved in D-alanine esterification of teichoic acids